MKSEQTFRLEFEILTTPYFKLDKYYVENNIVCLKFWNNELCQWQVLQHSIPKPLGDKWVITRASFKPVPDTRLCVEFDFSSNLHKVGYEAKDKERLHNELL